MSVDERTRRFADNVYALRVANGMSQTELAEKVGISMQTICRTEVGMFTPSFKVALMISDALGKSIGEMCENEYERPKGSYVVGLRRKRLV